MIEGFFAVTRDGKIPPITIKIFNVFIGARNLHNGLSDLEPLRRYEKAAEVHTLLNAHHL